MSLTQSMDQGVIKSFRRRYHRKLSEILGKLDGGSTGLNPALKMNDVICVVAKANDEMP